VVRIGIFLKNDADEQRNASSGINYADVVLLDTKASRTYFAFKDPAKTSERAFKTVTTRL